MTKNLTGNEIYYYKIEALQFSTLHGLSLNPCHDTYICFIGRNLDSLTTVNFRYFQTTSFSDFCNWDKNYGFNTSIMQNIWIFCPHGVRKNQY